jgi:hypothetical protein
MAKKRAGRSRPPQKKQKLGGDNYSPRDDARAFLPVVMSKLKAFIEQSDELNISLIKACELMVKQADVDSIPKTVDDAIEIHDAQPDDRKIVPITEAV